MGSHPPFIPLVWNAAADGLLGNQSDRSVAKVLDVHPETVQNRRKALGIPAWRQGKRVHRRNCVYCGEPFTVIGGRGDRLRKTCPPPKKCQRKQVAKMLELGAPAARLKQVSALLGMHFITDKDA
jgi:hypothetical protein